MRASLAVAVGLGMLLASSASAVELRFTEIQMPLGNNLSVVNLAGSEYLAFGISTANAYRYWDNRDPFSDGAENEGVSPYGLSCLNCTEEPARITFTTPVSNLAVDWWTIGADTFFLDVFDSGNNLIHSFNAKDSGTEVIPLSDISYITWHDSSGFVQISNLRFDETAPVPEPGTIALFGTGLLLLRKKRQQR